MALTQFTCANWDPSLLECKKAGTFTCKNCLLVVVSPSGTIPPVYLVVLTSTSVPVVLWPSLPEAALAEA